MFVSWVKDSADFELMAPAPLNLVCFRHKAGNEFNRKLMERLNDSGRMFLTHTMLRDEYVLRLCVGQTNTDREHIESAWRLIRETAEQLQG